MNLYFVFTYDSNGRFNPIRVISELSWDRLSNKYFDNRLKARKEIATWAIVDERSVDSIKYEELSLLDEVILVDNEGRLGDASEFRTEYIIRRLAGF